MRAENITLALPKGRTFLDALALLQKIGLLLTNLEDESRRLLIETGTPGVRLLLLRDRDVATYVEYGACDLGVLGLDLLREEEPQVYEPVDLGFGACRMVVAEPTGRVPRAFQGTVRVATKYPRMTERHFTARGVPVEVIPLYGSIELAPLVGLADQIVDLVQTGATLRDNGLVEVEEIMTVTSRLIVNRAALKTKHARVQEIIDRVRNACLPGWTGSAAPRASQPGD